MIVDFMRSYGEPISPTQTADIIDASLGSIAYHFRTLEQAGIVELADIGRVRGEHFYILTPVGRRQGGTKARVADLLGLCGVLTLPDPAGGVPRPSVLDEQARDDLRAILEEIQPRVREVAEAATKRAGKLVS